MLLARRRLRCCFIGQRAAAVQLFQPRQCVHIAEKVLQIAGRTLTHQRDAAMYQYAGIEWACILGASCSDCRTWLAVRTVVQVRRKSSSAGNSGNTWHLRWRSCAVVCAVSAANAAATTLALKTSPQACRHGDGLPASALSHSHRPRRRACVPAPHAPHRPAHRHALPRIPSDGIAPDPADRRPGCASAATGCVRRVPACSSRCSGGCRLFRCRCTRRRRTRNRRDLHAAVLCAAGFVCIGIHRLL